MKKNNVSMAMFVYDGDGNRVKSTINGVTTAFIGNWSEWSAGSTTNYYYAGTQRVAMRMDNALYYFLGDHLGSTSITTNSSGGLVSEMRYKPWGETRYTSGTTPTNYTYTGQYSNMGDFGLMFYNARWYDPSLGRFAQADTIIPGGAQGLDRYAYANNSPVIYIDPSGHCGVKQGKFDDKFDCTADDIEGATMEQRLAWFKGFLAATGKKEWFANIGGILEAFIDEGLGESNSWVSWVDAGTLVSVQNGFSLFSSKQTNDSAADMAWKDFFSATSDDERRTQWGVAEKLGNEYGISLANEHGAFMNKQEEQFLDVGNRLYRDLLANGQIEEFYGDMAADVGALYCDPGYHSFCNGWVEGWNKIGNALGGWFGDPRSRIPLINQAPVYFVARWYLEK